eukprot:CAMPEP_0196739554 /NCGR_PEP_ID=MMETSP1091-20130531/23385_1 /TAXON_ID=302021 /ORGANISM="Rhodomonas sp., Strain CCMP768" /LENGTH=106 /DNA_ID=CAMNT_0042084157 /DNA_START=18 /DNA_END=338 /DNA_ORIENTATION=+
MILIKLAAARSMLFGCGENGECWDKFGWHEDGKEGSSNLYPVGDCTPHAYHQDTWVPTFSTTGTCPVGGKYSFMLPKENEWENVWRHGAQNMMGGHTGKDKTGLHP